MSAKIEIRNIQKDTLLFTLILRLVDGLTESIGISASAIDNNIKTLKEKDIRERAGSDRTGYYKIIIKE
ncbi:hypothetical protein [Flagellimonas sp.]|uniref:hypothetical protein n=1 Tax=Flagellimonas sp. TaxID=2058762 RepID=UPI003BAD5AEE